MACRACVIWGAGHLMPHNKYQHAEYPEDEGGDEHIRRRPQDVRPGLSNQLGSHLFRDTIVKAAPGFNAGTGRHIRAQEGLDWERNWETHRESKTGRVPKSKRFPRNGHQVRRALGCARLHARARRGH